MLMMRPHLRLITWVVHTSDKEMFLSKLLPPQILALLGKLDHWRNVLQSGIIHQDVEAPKFVDGGIHQLNALGFSNACPYEQSLRAEAPKFAFGPRTAR
jgi:hypothetical protein